jgi:hypothetical protein
MTERALARTATLDLHEGYLSIDGVRLPWWLAKVDPEIAVDGVVELGVTFLIDGPVTLVGDASDVYIVDQELGEVGSWARRHVRRELLQAFPDLVLP